MDRRMTFDEAVEFLEELFEIQQYLTRPWAEWIAKGYYDSPENDRSRRLAWLIQASEKDACPWDTLSLIAQRLLRDNEPLPKELKHWMADVWEDLKKRPEPRKTEMNRPRPAKSGNDPYAKIERNMFIDCSVRALVRAGFHPTRSTRKAGPMASAAGGSACDAVGEAFGMSYRAVEKVWTAREKPTSSVGRP